MGWSVPLGSWYLRRLPSYADPGSPDEIGYHPLALHSISFRARDPPKKRHALAITYLGPPYPRQVTPRLGGGSVVAAAACSTTCTDALFH